MRGMVTGGTLFEELGFLFRTCGWTQFRSSTSGTRNLQNSKWDGPVFLHVVTKKDMDMSHRKI